ncbi:MAG: Nif3-like dinuclear metal center hexameric protein, partial [Armatimonadota bacterium]
EREIVPEVRIETVLPAARRDAVLRVLRANHPYEEAAFGFVVVDGDQRVSGGRVGTLSAGSLGEMGRTVADRLSAVVRVFGEEREVRRVAVFGGAGGG